MTATGLKQEGDDLYKQKKYHEAITKYTSSIDRCTNPATADIHLAYSNRCACYMHIGQFDKALEDANVCVAMKPTWPKGYSRKAACLESAQRIPEALACYEKLLQLDRTNTEATNAISRLSRSNGQQRNPPGASSSSSGAPPTNTSTPSAAGSVFDQFRNFDWRRLSSSVLDYVTYWYYRCLSWWQSLSPQTKLYIQCGVLVLFLYFMFFRPGYSGYDSGYGYGSGYGSGYGYGGYGGGYGGYGGYGGGMSWTTWGLIMVAAYKVPPMLPDLLGEQYARPFFGMSWTTFMWLLNMFSRNTGRMGGIGGYGGYGGMPGGMFGQRRRW